MMPLYGPLGSRKSRITGRIVVCGVAQCLCLPSATKAYAGNPPGGDKAAWLAANAKEITLEQAKAVNLPEQHKAGNLLLACVYNGFGTAIAVVMFGLGDYILPEDTRPKRFFTVPLVAVQRDMPNTGEMVRRLI